MGRNPPPPPPGLHYQRIGPHLHLVEDAPGPGPLYVMTLTCDLTYEQIEKLRADWHAQHPGRKLTILPPGVKLTLTRQKPGDEIGHVRWDGPTHAFQSTPWLRCYWLADVEVEIRSDRPLTEERLREVEAWLKSERTLNPIPLPAWMYKIEWDMAMAPKRPIGRIYVADEAAWQRLARILPGWVGNWPDVAAMTAKQFRRWLLQVQDGMGRFMWEESLVGPEYGTIFGIDTDVHALHREIQYAQMELARSRALRRKSTPPPTAPPSGRPFLRERRYLFGFIPFGWRYHRQA